MAFGISLLIFLLIGGFLLRAACALFNLLAARFSTVGPVVDPLADADFDSPAEPLPLEPISSSPYASPLTTSPASEPGPRAVPPPSLLRATAISAFAFFLYLVLSIGFSTIGIGAGLSVTIVVPGFLLFAMGILTTVLAYALPTSSPRALAVATLFVVLVALIFAGVGILVWSVALV